MSSLNRESSHFLYWELPFPTVGTLVSYGGNENLLLPGDVLKH